METTAVVILSGVEERQRKSNKTTYVILSGVEE